MKKNIIISLKLTGLLILICAGIYPLFIAGIGKLAPGDGEGIKLHSNDRIVGYSNVGQRFTSDEYFQGRPSAVDYNGAGSGGSNKSAGNKEYLQVVQERIDTFLAHNPDIKKTDIPSELVTASGSGLDPHISAEGARVQIARIAKARSLNAETLQKLVDDHTEENGFGPKLVHVLKLNIALDKISSPKN